MAVDQASTKDETTTSVITGVVRAITQPGGKDIDWEKVRAAGAIIGGISVIVGLRHHRWRYIHTFGVVLAIAAAAAEDALGVKILHFVPDDAKLVNRANNNGAPVLLQSPNSKISHTINDLATSIAESAMKL